MGNDRSLEGRVALVTGAGRGLGRAYAYALADRGAKVVVNNRSAAAGDEVVAEIGRRGAEATGAHGDLEDPATARAIVDTAIATYGKLDILINNAGGIDAPLAPFAEMTAADRDACLRQNFTSTWDVTAAAWPHLLDQGYGRVILTASPMSVYGGPGFAHYSAAKSALIGLCRVLVVEAGDKDVKVNVINPVANTRKEPQEGAWNAWFEEAFSVDYVADGVAWLVDERCTATGEIFTLGAARMAQVSITEQRGLIQEIPSFAPEAIGEQFDTVFDGGAPVQFRTITEYLGFYSQLYGAPA